MGACAAGARSCGGAVIGVAPRCFDEAGFLCKEYGEFFFTDTMAERKERMLELAEAFIALPGGTGTLDELFETLALKQLGQLRKPVVLLDTLGYYAPLHALLRDMVAKGFNGESTLGMISLCASPEEALARALMPEPDGKRSVADYSK